MNMPSSGCAIILEITKHISLAFHNHFFFNFHQREKSPLGENWASLYGYKVIFLLAHMDTIININMIEAEIDWRFIVRHQNFSPGQKSFLFPKFFLSLAVLR